MEIQEKLEALKVAIMRAEGAMAAIEGQWLKQFGTKDLKEILDIKRKADAAKLAIDTKRKELALLLEVINDA